MEEIRPYPSSLSSIHPSIMTSQSQSLVKSLSSSSSSYSDRALMPPPPPSSQSRTSTALSTATASLHPPKRIKRPSTVLDEDSYTDALGHIIARDFFPGLLESRAEQTYLDAVESGDLEWIAEAKRQLYETREGISGGSGVAKRKRKEREAWIHGDRQQYTGEKTPANWRGSTPGSIAGGSNYSLMGSVIGSEDGISEDGRTRERRRRAIRTDLSLTAFQTKYTSEDNESFNALLDKQAEKKAAKYSWLTDGNKILSKRQIAYRTRQTRLLEEGDSQRRKLEKETGVHDENGKDESGAMVIHSSSSNKDSAVGSNMAGMEDTRPAMPDIRPPPPRNSLMFLPDSVEDTHETVAQASEAASKAGPKTVVYPNTRMASAAATSSSSTTAPRPSSPTLSAIRDAVAGHPRLSASESGSVYGHDDSNNNNNNNNSSRDDDYDPATPRVNGYTFVDEEPEPGEQIRLQQRQRRQQLLLEAQQEEQKEEERQKQKMLRKQKSHNDPSTQQIDQIDSTSETTNLLAPLTETRRHQHHGVSNNTSHDRHTNPNPNSFPGEEEDGENGEDGGGGVRPVKSRATNPFKIRQSSRREALHHALVARTAAKKRAAAASVYGGHYCSTGSPGFAAAASAASAAGTGTGTARAGRTPTPRFASAPAIRQATGNLTPAGQKLLRSIGTTPRARHGGVG